VPAALGVDEEKRLLALLAIEAELWGSSGLPSRVGTSYTREAIRGQRVVRSGGGPMRSTVTMTRCRPNFFA
jgi:hypothetical protein